MSKEPLYPHVPKGKVKTGIFKIPEDLQPQLKPLIIELNTSGFRTSESCAGYYFSKHGKERVMGYITLKGVGVDGKLTQQENTRLHQILGRYGLQDLAVHYNSYGFIGFTYIEFAPIGKVK